jgi:F420-dependent oxidoreductase-like protein
VYPPTTLAQQALSIEILSCERYVLGVGLGHQVLLEDILGLKIDRPLAYLREYLAVLLSLLRGDAIDHHGEFFDIRLEPVMGAPRCPPVLVAALGPQMLRLAATLADGPGLTMMGLRYLEREAMPTLAKAAADASRGPLRIAFAAPVSVTRAVEAARAAARTMISYENLPAYRRLLDADGLRDAADISIIGDEDTVRASLTRLADLGVTDLVAMQLRFDEDPAAGERTRQLLTVFAANA